jgi:hypothetical protein
VHEGVGLRRVHGKSLLSSVCPCPYMQATLWWVATNIASALSDSLATLAESYELAWRLHACGVARMTADAAAPAAARLSEIDAAVGGGYASNMFVLERFRRAEARAAVAASEFGIQLLPTGTSLDGGQLNPPPQTHQKQWTLAKALSTYAFTHVRGLVT